MGKAAPHEAAASWRGWNPSAVGEDAGVNRMRLTAAAILTLGYDPASSVATAAGEAKDNMIDLPPCSR